MINFRYKYSFVLMLLVLCYFSACSGGGSSESIDPSTDITPSFNPSTNDSLTELAVNTFLDAGIDIKTSPTYIDFNAENGDIDKNDEIQIAYTLSNNSGETRDFSFQIYSVSSGFSILDENKENIGAYTAIQIEDGDSKTFYVQFNAWLFGSHTSYLTITSNVEGYIQLPFRAIVSGSADLKIIPAGYFCHDDEAPIISQLDFFKVATSITKTHTIKICNTGGTDIKINTADINSPSSALQSSAMSGNAFEEFLWKSSDEINASFSFGTAPTYQSEFSNLNYIDYPGTVEDSTSMYSITVSHTGDIVEDLIIEAGQLLLLDINFTPTLDLESESGVLYNPKSLNSSLAFTTSLGTIEVPLLGASSGIEPVLALSYRFDPTEPWRTLDLTSESPAIYFGTTEIFLDWVSNNKKTVEINLTNVGSGSKDLLVYGGAVNGFFEYYWNDDASPLEFPLNLAAGVSKALNIRYLPSPTSDLDDSFSASWDFGQFYFDHTGGNGPNGKVSLVAEQDAGFSTQLFYGGAELEREYQGDQYKNICVFTTDSQHPTVKTFRVVNNNQDDAMSVSWNISDSDAELTIKIISGSFEIAPGKEQSFSIEAYAGESAVGLLIGGTLNVTTSFPQKESEYAALLADVPYGRNFTVPFKATGSDSGTSSLCGGGVLGDDDTMQVTFIMDRIIMTLTSLVEPNRNPPGFKYHLPFEVNIKKGTARISKPSPFIWDKSDEQFSPVKQIRSYIHQATNIQGCAPLPSNPYRLEFQKGSWTGAGIECQGSTGVDGTLTFSDPNNPDGSVTINSDTACLDNNGGEEYTDTDGTRWVVFYHDFVKFDNCNTQYYGKVATMSFKPDVEEIYDVYELAEASPNESEDFYENIYKTYQHKSYITFFEDTTCGSSLSAVAGQTIIDNPDLIKDWFVCLGNSSDQTKRDKGFVDECSYFNFSIDAGVEPESYDFNNPDPDNWEGFGSYEPHVDDTGKIHSTKYDMTIYNAHMRAIVIGAGDRVKFFGHPGHLVYSHIYANITTKRVVEESALEDGSWKESLALNARSHFNKDQLLLENGNPIDTSIYWTGDQLTSLTSNSIDGNSLAPGINHGGYGRGNFRFHSEDSNKIIHAGWPINYDENNLAVLVALGAFAGKGNTSPSFTKADAATGKGKSLYFTFHGCFIEGDPSESQGCYDYHRDTGSNSSGASFIDLYEDAGILPDGYPTDAADCSLLEDAGFEDRFDYKYISCINFKVEDVDRDRMNNYYNRSSRVYQNEDLYKSTSCGQGM